MARFFGGGLSEILVACAIGFVSGALWLAMARSASGVRVYELVAAALASLMAQAAAHSSGSRCSCARCPG